MVYNKVILLNPVRLDVCDYSKSLNLTLISLLKIKTFSNFFGPFLTYIYILRWIQSSFCSKLCYLGNIQEASEFASTQNGCLDFSLSIMKRIQNIPGFFFNFLHLQYSISKTYLHFLFISNIYSFFQRGR